jgi:hypothetical protein
LENIFENKNVRESGLLGDFGNRQIRLLQQHAGALIRISTDTPKARARSPLETRRNTV